jgi:hypothetical protein
MQIIQKAVFVVTLSLATGVFSFGQKPMGDSVATLAGAMVIVIFTRSATPLAILALYHNNTSDLSGSYLWQRNNN